MNDVYSKIPRKKGYVGILEKRVKELETIVAKFGCYEDGKPITCLHCPDADRCGERYSEVL